MGQLHDSRYKKLHQQHAVMLEWSRHVSTVLDLGEVVPDSLRVHTPAFTDDRLHSRLADGGWEFRTEREAHLLLMSEYQSTRDPILHLRQCHYALSQLIAGYEARHFRVREGFPAPIVVALYTGAEAHQPKPVEDLIGRHQRHLFHLKLPTLHLDMLHMPVEEIPDRALLRTIFQVEREWRPRPAMAQLEAFLQQSTDSDLNRALVIFGAASLARWAETVDAAGQPLLQEEDLARITQAGELVMQAEVLQKHLDDLRAEGEAQGIAQGEAQGEARGEARAKREALMSLARIFCTPAQLAAFVQELDQTPSADWPGADEVYWRFGPDHRAREG